VFELLLETLMRVTHKYKKNSPIATVVQHVATYLQEKRPRAAGNTKSCHSTHTV